MTVGVYIVTIIILVIIVYVFLIITGKDTAVPDGRWQPPPDPYLKDYIEDVQKASTNLYNTTQFLLLTTSNTLNHIGATFGAYDLGTGVEDYVPAAARKSVDSVVSSANKKLKSYADEVDILNKIIKTWTTSTANRTLLGQKVAVDALANDILNPMAEFQMAAGQLSTFTSDWNAAYESVSQGGICSRNSDCSKYHQSCISGRCAVSMNRTMRGLISDISTAAKTLSIHGALTTSPYRKLVKTVQASYMALFDHIVGI